MADLPGIRISLMNSTNSLTGSEEVPIVQSGTNFRTTTQAIANLAGGAIDLTPFLTKADNLGSISNPATALTNILPSQGGQANKVLTSNGTTASWQNGTPGPQGAAGTNGTNGATWRQGTGTPSNSLGVDGDFFLATDTLLIWQRSSGTYSTVVTLPEVASSDTNKMTVSTAGAVTTLDVTNVATRGDTPTVVQAATTGALAANTYANGSSGVGATLTANANGAIAAIDGYSPVLNDLLLINNEATAANNGVYKVTQVGDGSHPYILTRGTAHDQPGELIAGHGTVLVANGTLNGGTIWYLTGTVTTVGTTAVTWLPIYLGSTQVRGGQTLGAGFIQFDGVTTITGHVANILNVSSGGYSTGGLTGATTAVRWVGGTSSGAPASGTFSTGDVVFDQTGHTWICTSGGTPGTWVCTSTCAAIFGTGSDGVINFDGSTTRLGLVPSGNAYTLNRDIYLAGGSQLSGSAVIKTAGWRIFCNGILTVGASAAIRNDGNAAAGQTAGGNRVAGSIDTATGAGTNGATGAANGATATTVSTSAAVDSTVATTVNGAKGGGTSAGTGNGTNAAGTVTLGTSHGLPRNLFDAMALFAHDAATTKLAGSVGGNGGDAAASTTGGGGGGGAGVIFIAARNLINSGTISAVGGAGAAASGSGAGGGGGGGGGGGIIYLYEQTSGAGTITVAGGSGGAGVNSGGTGGTGPTGVIWPMSVI